MKTPLTRTKLRDIGVTTKIAASVGLAVISGIAVGVVGLTSLSTAADSAQASYQENTQGLAHVEEMRNQLMTMQFRLAVGLLSTADADRAENAQDMAAGRNAFAAANAAYQGESKPNPVQTAIVGDVSTAYNQWQDASARGIAAFTAGDLPTAQAANTESTAAIANVTAAMDKLVNSELAEAKASAADAQTTHDHAMTVLILVLALGSAIAIAAGLLVAKGIRSGLLKVQTAAQRLADGDLTHTTGIDQRDEIGQTAAAMDAATDGLRSVIASVVASATRCPRRPRS